MLTIDSSQAKISSDDLEQFQPLLEREILAMQAVVETGGYHEDRASLNLLDDNRMLDQIERAAQSFRGADTIVLVGMGGPGLGARAVQEAIQGTLHTAVQSARPSASSQVFYLDSIDPTRVVMLTEILQGYQAQNKKIVIVVATQSGTTAETVANLEYFLTFLEQHDVDPREALSIITNDGSPLDYFSHERGLSRVLVSPLIGGRYSIFSALGLFPLSLMGIDINKLLAGARDARRRGLNQDLVHNIAARSAATIAIHYSAGRHILVNSMLKPDYESVGLWCRQLMAESLGKKQDQYGHVVHIGYMPTVEISSRDLHSMFQLHMEGPDDTLTRFVRVATDDQVKLPVRPEFEALVPQLQGASYQRLTHAITEGVLHAYRAVERPYLLTDLDGSVADLGSFLQTMMMETMFLGRLMNINPFNQPGVGLYKSQMKKLLAQD
ncbi:hypothetical protein HY524_02055 [Candidatus Berkelbacteria bacterium]|nr:hypothetical protein [Candidatus Berkelbacteria bacterium]